MRCVKPIPAYALAGRKTKKGKRVLAFREPEKTQKFEQIAVPCGNCIKCRLRKAGEWTIRLEHEAKMHSCNSFLTLTIDDEHLAEDRSLDKSLHQKFIRSLRKRLRRDYDGKKIRYFICGEYGGQFGRPHYHAIIFGFDFPDRKLLTYSNGMPLWTSELLDRCWPHGMATIGQVTADSCSYVSGYVVKKINGKKGKEIDPVTGLKPYEHLDLESGEIYSRVPEYGNMSLKPGIGSTWFDKFETDVFPSDFVVRKGRPMAVPKYYDCLLERESESRFEEIKGRRERFALAHGDILDCTLGRQEAVETALKSRQSVGRDIGRGKFRNLPGVSAEDLARDYWMRSKERRR